MMERAEKGKKKVLDFLKFWIFPYLPSLPRIPLHFFFSVSVRGPVQFVSGIVCEGSPGVFFER